MGIKVYWSHLRRGIDRSNFPQIGAMSFCGIMRAIMAHNGGKHAWDISLDQAHEAAFVSLPSL